MQLTLLIRNLDHSRFHVTVITIYEAGNLARDLQGIENVQVVSLAKQSGLDNFLVWPRLSRLVRSLRPHVVHGYLDSGNVRALVAGKWSKATVIWGVRSSNMEVTPLSRTAHSYRKLANLLSGWTDLIICNSEAGRDHAVRNGYPPRLVNVIPNGFDTSHFLPDPDARMRQRRDWGTDGATPLVGLVARLDPIKDHPTFLRAAALVIKDHPEVRFVCVGGGAKHYGTALQDLAVSLGIDRHVCWAGEQSDMPAVYNALDIVVSTSVSEGFSNSLGEAMACGVACVATDVGDARAILGDTGILVPPGNPEAVAAAFMTLLGLSPDEFHEVGVSARERIVQLYGVDALVERTTRAIMNVTKSG